MIECCNEIDFTIFDGFSYEIIVWFRMKIRIQSRKSNNFCWKKIIFLRLKHYSNYSYINTLNHNCAICQLFWYTKSGSNDYICITSFLLFSWFDLWYEYYYAKLRSIIMLLHKFDGSTFSFIIDNITYCVIRILIAHYSYWNIVMLLLMTSRIRYDCFKMLVIINVISSRDGQISILIEKVVLF